MTLGFFLLTSASSNAGIQVGVRVGGPGYYNQPSVVYYGHSHRYWVRGHYTYRHGYQRWIPGHYVYEQ